MKIFLLVILLLIPINSLAETKNNKDKDIDMTIKVNSTQIPKCGEIVQPGEICYKAKNSPKRTLIVIKGLD